MDLSAEIMDLSAKQDRKNAYNYLINKHLWGVVKTLRYIKILLRVSKRE